MGRKTKDIIKCPNCGEDIVLKTKYEECSCWDWGRRLSQSLSFGNKRKMQKLQNPIM